MPAKNNTVCFGESQTPSLYDGLSFFTHYEEGKKLKHPTMP